MLKCKHDKIQKKYKRDKIQTLQNTESPKYKQQKITRYKCDKIQKSQDCAYATIAIFSNWEH